MATFGSRGSFVIFLVTVGRMRIPIGRNHSIHWISQWYQKAGRILKQCLVAIKYMAVDSCLVREFVVDWVEVLFDTLVHLCLVLPVDKSAMKSCRCSQSLQQKAIIHDP